MQFLKKHYEKILLSIVLLGLAAAAAALPILVSQEREQIDSKVGVITKAQGKKWESIDLSTNQQIVQRLEGSIRPRLFGEHNLFNPVRWVRTQGGGIKKIISGNEIGIGALVATKITPLNLVVKYEGIPPGEKIQYTVSVLRETGDPNQRPLPGSAAVGVKNAQFTIQQVDGPPDAPAALHLQLKDEKESIVVRKDKPYTRVIGYVADLLYPPDNNQRFLRKKVGDTILLKGEEPHKIVVINEKEVVVSPSDKGRRTTVRLNESVP